MYKYLYVGNIRVPTYGLVVLLGIVVCNLIASYVIKRKKLEYTNYFVITLLAGIVGIFGAKSLTIVSYCARDGFAHLSWDMISKAGYSYYGGLWGFFIGAFIIGKLSKADYKEYDKELVFLLPLLHAFWKMGCFAGGCCYGMPYHGNMSVVFPDGINRMSGTETFPVQLLEAIVALLIAIILIYLNLKGRLYAPVGTYLVLYGSTRFCIEFLRFHDTSSLLSNGHVYSIITILIGTVLIIRGFRGRVNYE